MGVLNNKSERGPNVPRRGVIYPHRSFRALPLNPVSLALGIALAALLSMLAWGERHDLARAHQEVTAWFLDVVGLTEQWAPRTATIFPAFLQAPSPAVAVPVSSDVREPMRFTAILGSLFLLLLTKRNTIARGFFYFLLLLLVAGALVLTVFSHIHLNAESVTEMWLRTEFPVWVLMPWFAAFLFLVMNPDWRAGLAWMLLVLTWVFVTSALREAFAIGVMHFTGILFFPVLWFLFGFLFDLLIVLVAYSVSLHWANAHVWGRRKEMTA